MKTDSALSAVGLKQGTFDVDGNGQATFRLPFEVPPGIGGLAPDIGLAYSHRAPNGTVGVGWGLSGLSAITRVKATYAVDGFNGSVDYGPEDRLALDGQRLINVEGEYGAPGTVYWTELQTWQRVTAGASSEAGFTVVTKTGEIHEFGTTEDSRVLAVGTSYVRVWLLAAVTDRNGNRIEFRYTGSPDGTDESDGSWFVSEIRYNTRADGLQANRVVSFAYETRPDPIVEYVGGYLVRLGHRLSSVTVSVNGDTVRGYALEYGTGQPTNVSVLTAVRQTGAAAGTTYTPLGVVWSGTADPGFDISPSSTLDQHLGTVDLRPMDVTGSGRTDLVQLWKDDVGQLHATTWLATPGDAGTTFVRGSDSTLGAFPTNAELYPADVDGDGRTDLVVIYPSGPDSELKIAVFLSDGTGFASAGTYATGSVWSSKHIQFFAMDCNGDGRTDIVEAYAYYDATYGNLLYFRTWLSRVGDGSGALFTDTIVSPTTDAAYPTTQLAFWPMDVDGNGMVDLVRVWQRSNQTVVATAYLGVSSSIDAVSFAGRVQTELGLMSLTNQISFLPVDLNGDGTADLLQIWQDGTTLHFTTWLCDGAGGFATGPDTAFADETLTSSGFYPMDLDGSGSTAIVKKWISGDERLKFTAFRSSADGTFRAAPTFDAGAASADATFLPGDVNGDGKADLIRVTLDINHRPVVVPYTSAGDYPDLATSITNGLGGVVRLSYLPLSDAGVYTPSSVEFPQGAGRRFANPLTPTQYPIQSVMGRAVYVVSSFEERNDVATNRFAYDVTRTLTYEGAAVDLLGRGWQGFATVTRTEDDRITTTAYNQGFPFTGTIAQTAIAGTAGLLSVQSSTYSSVDRAEGVVEVLRATARVEGYVDGAFDYAMAHTYDYDDYGNETCDTNLGYVEGDVPIDPAAVVYRYRSYRNVDGPDGWMLGFLLFDKKSANPTDSDISRFLPGDWTLSARVPDANGNVATSSVWDDSNGVWLSTGYTYDDYGNVRTVTRPGGFVTTTDWDPDYHTYRTRETSPPDAQGVSLVASYGYDPRFGIEVARQDANGFVWITGVDAFGRVSGRQGPVPAGVTPSVNMVPSQVTGDSAVFGGASVVTLEMDLYLDDGQGGLYTEVRSLQSFPTGATFDYGWNRKYVDGRGRDREVVRQTGQTAGNAVTLKDVDADGNATRESLPFFSTTDVVTDAPHWIVTTYDAIGRPVRKETPYGPDGSGTSVTTWAYGLGEQVTQTRGAGTDDAVVEVYVHHYYDGNDKVSQATADGVTVFTYDPIARLTDATDPGGVSNTQTWDSVGRLTSIDNPDQNATGDGSIKAMTYAYDPVTGQQASQTDASGAVTTFAFDAIGRLTRRSLPDGRVITYVWDDASVNGMGRMTSVTVSAADGSVESVVSLGYDSYGNEASRTVTVDGEIFTLTTTYDPQRRAVTQQKPDGTTLTRSWSYGELVSQTLDGVTVDYPLESYSPAQRAGRLDYGNGVSTTYAFEPVGQVIGETVTGAGGTIIDDRYTFDVLSQLRSIDAVGGSNLATFTYARRRLSTAYVAGIGSESATFDTAGNLQVKGGVTYTGPAHFAASGVSQGVTVYEATRDACGRTRTRTTNGVTLTFDYDGLGCLSRVTGADGTVVRAMLNGYDGRILRQVDASGNVLLTVDPSYQVSRPAGGGTIVTKYVLDDRGVAASIDTRDNQRSIRYFRRDFKGSNTHAFDEGGAVVSTVAYAAWGARTVLTGDGDFRPKYEQRPFLDDIGLYWFGARWYDPAVGRFLTPDSELGSTDLTRQDALNRFSFELGDPINHADPTGHKAAWIIGLVIGLLAIVTAAAVILSGGAATPAMAVAMGALLGAGLNASIYSATHRDVSGWKFVGGYVVNAAVGAIIGGATAGISTAVGAAMEQATAQIASRAAQFGLRALAYTVTGAAMTSGFDAFNQFMSNVTDRYIIKDESVELGDGVGRAAITGAIMGTIAGLGQAAAETKLLRRTGESLEDLKTERTPLRPVDGGGYGAVEQIDQFERTYYRIPNTLRARAWLFGISESSTIADAWLEVKGY